MEEQATPANLECKCTELDKSKASFQVHCTVIVMWIIMAFVISIGYGLMLQT